MFQLNPQKLNPQASNLKIATTDLVLIALFASLGLATKNIIHPLVATITGPLYIPTGAAAGGIYMMWPILAFGLTRRIGASSMVSLIQAVISLLLPFGNFGLLSLIIYLAPGLTIDATLLVSRKRDCSLGCCVAAAAIANIVGTVLVGALVLFLPWAVLSFLVVVAAISGSIGGFIANMLLVRIRTIGFRRFRT